MDLEAKIERGLVVKTTLSEKGEMSHVGSGWLNHPLGSGQVTGSISCVSIIWFDGKEATCSIAPSQDCARWWTYKGQMGWENDMSAHEQAQKPFGNFFFDWCCVHRFLCAILLQEKVGDDKSWSFNSNKLEAVTKLAAPVVRKSDWPAVNVTVMMVCPNKCRFWWGSYLMGMWYVTRPGDLVKHSMWCHRILQRTVSWLTAFCSLSLLRALRCSQGNPSTPESDVKLMPSCFPFVCLIEAALCNYLSLCRL